ncbi:hypothetical protein BDV32DRAFT_119166 [Aspergillus pseudonomiae]|uniref:Uncharacterized protein n=1 Tax=Aspergillus pseudonomiae TaxID=1506151 RepID=A0A5N7DTP9_9EURO|nr:uncharacterized protein BDV37DRAFT_235196 [Aspergillus pseudonomiae]KAB8263307.1 hypothetical protein BDV32DRAFT_119166 [Aspergillus pseudonomiae]KAE8409847.1 hypothetical protein BDV37DRAFT_235196 [Aspergillus pseudonomiae]
MDCPNVNTPSLIERNTGSETGALGKRICVRQFSERIATWPEEDWSGISDSKQRRRLQNRLNQRARRLRNKQDTQAPPDDQASDRSNRSSADKGEHALAVATSPKYRKQLSNRACISDSASAISLAAIEHVHILEPDSAHTKRVLQQLEVIAHTYYVLGSPRTDLLLHLIQFNFTKALIENTRVLGLTSEQLHDDAISPFNIAGPWPYNFEASLPSSLQPTTIQRTILHHPWLDLLPVPEMRNNLILAEDSYDETQLCLDMKGAVSVSTSQTGIIVWRDPWDASGWEVTEPFARSWGWVIRGCRDLRRSTNAWRARRNERPLFRVS